MTHGGAALPAVAAAETQFVAQLSHSAAAPLLFVLGFADVFSASKVSQGKRPLSCNVSSGDGHGHTMTHMFITVIVMIECVSCNIVTHMAENIRYMI